MAIGTPAKYVCDYCKKPIKMNGCIDGHHHYTTAGINRSGDKNHIQIVDGKGDKPDLCHTCLLREIARMLEVYWTDNINTEPIMGRWEHYRPTPIAPTEPFIYLPDTLEDKDK